METQQTFKIKSSHHWFEKGLILNLTYENNGEKVIRFIGPPPPHEQECPGKDEEKKNGMQNSKGVLFDPTNPDDIQTLFMFTGTSQEDLYCLEDEEDIRREEKRLHEKWGCLHDREPTPEEKQQLSKEWAVFHAKYEQKRRDIRKWIYSYPLKPGIKMVSERTCGCNMGHCGAILGIELEKNVYNTLGELFALFSCGPNVPCYARFSSCASSQNPDVYRDPCSPSTWGKKCEGQCTCDSPNSDNPWYEHPDSVLLYLQKADKDRVYKVHQGGSCYNKAKDVKLAISDEDCKFTIMSWSYGR